MTNHPQNLNIIFFVLTFLMVVALGTLSYFLDKADAENEALRESLELMEGSIESEREQNQLLKEQLQREVEIQQKLNQQLQAEIAALEKIRIHINFKANEDKEAIARIRSVDSLRNEISRHYPH